jgi:hypothetical protein
MQKSSAGKFHGVPSLKCGGVEATRRTGMRKAGGTRKLMSIVFPNARPPRAQTLPLKKGYGSSHWQLFVPLTALALIYTTYRCMRKGASVIE